jgi:hypothetical protein
VTRPDPIRWLWYALGGRLGPRYREWVLHDATCRTWRLRHFARIGVQLLIVTPLILLLVPGPLWVRLLSVLLGWLVALRYGLFIMEGSVEHRVVKAGYPAGEAQRVRERATAAERAAAARRYAERYGREPS